MQRYSFALVALFSAVLLAFSAGCGGGGTGPFIGVTPPPIAPSMATITFSGPSAQTFSVSEPGYTGTFTGKSGNPNVALITLTTVSSQAHPLVLKPEDTVDTFTVTPVGGGSTTLTISDQNGHTITIPVTVSSLTFSPQLH